MPRLAGVPLLLCLLLLSLNAAAHADAARGPARGAKAPDFTTSLPPAALSAEQRRSLADKESARRAAAADARAQASRESSGKPADVKTLRPAPAPADPSAMEALRQRKESLARRDAAPRAASRAAGTTDALGPIPRPQWLLDLLRQRAPGGATPSRGDPRRPADAGAGSAPPVPGGATSTSRLGVKAPELSRIGSGPATPSAAEQAKRAAATRDGGAR